MYVKGYLNCINCGEYDCSDMHSWGPGIRNVHIFHLVTKGKGYFEMCSKTYTVSKGQVFYIYPNETVYYYPDYDDPFSYKWINFCGTEVENLIHHTGFTKQSPVSPILPLEEISSLFDDANSGTSTFAQRIRSNAAVMNIFALLVVNYPSDTLNSDKYDYKSCAVDYISANLHKDTLCVQDIADNVGICRAHLYRIFKKSFGVSPVNYIINTRIESACEILKSTGLSIKVVAYSVGFSDPLYFSLSFKKSIGVSPSQFRESNKM